MKKLLFYFVFALVFLMLVLMPLKAEAIAYSVKEGIDIVFDTLIPTLFPFMFLSNFLFAFGGGALSYLFSPFLCPLFGISKNAAKAVILGLLGGFPMGSSVAAQMYKNGEISKEEAERLPIFSNNAGIMFVLGTVGLSHFSSFKAGLLLYFVHIFSSLIAGVLTKEKTPVFLKKEETKNKVTEIKSLAPAFSSSVLKSGISIAMISLDFIIFKVFTSLLGEILPKGDLCAFLGGLFEVTGGILSLSQSFQGLVLSAFLLGFNGLCVHMQGYFEMEKAHLSIKRCIKWKFFNGLFSSLLILIIRPNVFSDGSVNPPFIFYLLVFLLPLAFLLPQKVYGQRRT